MCRFSSHLAGEAAGQCSRVLLSWLANRRAVLRCAALYCLSRLDSHVTSSARPQSCSAPSASRRPVVQTLGQSGDDALLSEVRRSRQPAAVALRGTSLAVCTSAPTSRIGHIRRGGVARSAAAAALLPESRQVDGLRTCPAVWLLAYTSPCAHTLHVRSTLRCFAEVARRDRRAFCAHRFSVAGCRAQCHLDSCAGESAMSSL